MSTESIGFRVHVASLVLSMFGSWKAALFGLGLLLAALHPWLLRGGASLLVASAPEGDADAIFIAEGDGRFDLAAQACEQQGELRLLLVREPFGRLIELQIVPSKEQVAARELLARGVSADAIEILDQQSDNPWQDARALSQWLARHPQARVVVYCERLDSARTRYIYRSVLPLDQVSRVSFHGLRDRRHDETNWWLDKVGIKVCVRWWFAYAYSVIRGEDPRRPPRLSAEAYDAWVFD